jgi:hypothetical protein
MIISEELKSFKTLTPDATSSELEGELTLKTAAVWPSYNYIKLFSSSLTGATTLSILTFSITTLSITTHSI